MRRQRADDAGTWHHVMNRSVARRPMFEGRDDVRSFLAGVAQAVRRGEIEVFAYCVLTTHFHLLVRSPIGRLSVAMRRIQGRYAQRFNRRQLRDGALVRGRYLSKVAASARYRAVLVRYIDQNPVAAGLCRDARDYPWCSAFQFARRAPRWLSRSWVDVLVGPSGYPAAGAGPGFVQLDELVQARLRSDAPDDRFDELVTAAPRQVRERLRQNAAAADGRPCAPCAAASGLLRAVGSLARGGPWPIRRGSRTVCGWTTLRAGLLRDCAGEPLARIADALGVHEAQASRLHRRHVQLLLEDDTYADRAAAVLHAHLAQM